MSPSPVFHPLQNIENTLGTLTAGNVSSLADGAAAVVLTTQANALKLGLKPKARVIGYADEAVEPIDFNIASIKAINKVNHTCSQGG